MSHGTFVHEPTPPTGRSALALYLASTGMLAVFGARGWTLAVNAGLAAALGLVGILAVLSVHSALTAEFALVEDCCSGCPGPFERRTRLSMAALLVGALAAAPAPLVGSVARRAWARLF